MLWQTWTKFKHPDMLYGHPVWYTHLFIFDALPHKHMRLILSGENCPQRSLWLFLANGTISPFDKILVLFLWRHAFHCTFFASSSLPNSHSLTHTLSLFLSFIPPPPPPPFSLPLYLPDCLSRRFERWSIVRTSSVVSIQELFCVDQTGAPTMTSQIGKDTSPLNMQNIGDNNIALPCLLEM